MDTQPLVQLFHIGEEAAGKRTDVYLAEQLPDYTRSYIQKLIKGAQVLANDKPVKTGYKLADGDCLKVSVPEPEEPEIEAEELPLSILYEDTDLIVVDKPKGMVVHPANGHYCGTLVNALLYHCKEELSGINGVMRPGIVHRIDMDTTGALVVCKNDFTHKEIAVQLKEHSVARKYRAIVHGILKEDHGTIETIIGRHPIHRKKMAVLKSETGGKRAVTHWKVLERLNGYTYIECELETGRTHQIRVHMSHIHHPILGDQVYGPDKCRFVLEGQTLHAAVLGFIHPRKQEYMEFHAPLPNYFEQLLKKLHIHF